jgi:hypothetical protein
MSFHDVTLPLVASSDQASVATDWFWVVQETPAHATVRSGVLRPGRGGAFDARIRWTIMRAFRFMVNGACMPHRTRHALLIGNDAYADAPLRNPVNDARAMTAELRRLGFDAMLRTNVTKRALDEAVRAFVPTLRPDGVVVVFFAGHGLQHDGMSYLLPVDTDIDRDVDIPYEAYPAQRLVDALAQSGVRLSVIVLDACRANAVRVARAAGVTGLAPLSTVTFRSVRRRPQDYAIVYATEPGDVAADSRGGRHSSFTEALIASLRVPGLSFDEVMHRTTAAVHRATGYDQRPVAHMSLTGRQVLHPDGGVSGGTHHPSVARPHANPRPPPKHDLPRPRPAAIGVAGVDLEDWLRLTANEVGSKAAGSSSLAYTVGGSASAPAGGTTVSTSGGGVSVSGTGGSVWVGSTGGGVSVTVNGVPVQLSDATSGGREPADVTVAHVARILTESMRNSADPERIADDLLEFDGTRCQRYSTTCPTTYTWSSRTCSSTTKVHPSEASGDAYRSTDRSRPHNRSARVGTGVWPNLRTGAWWPPGARCLGEARRRGQPRVAGVADGYGAGAAPPTSPVRHGRRAQRRVVIAVAVALAIAAAATAFFISPDPVSDGARGVVESAVNGYLHDVAVRGQRNELTKIDRSVLGLGVAVGLSVYAVANPDAARVLRHYLAGEGAPLELEPGLFQQSPVIADAIRRLGPGDHGPIGFQQHEDWALSLCLNPFFLRVERGEITVYHPRVEFTPSSGPLVETVIPVGKLRIRVYDNLVHALGGTPFRVQASWRSN